MKVFIIMFGCLLTFGCASAKKVPYNVTSYPPKSQIDVNGVSMGETPTTIILECNKKWVGVMNAPGGWMNASGKYEVKAYPPKNFQGQTQSKQIDPCQWKGTGNAALKFDLGLESVTPKQQIEITTKSLDNDGKTEEAIKALKTLRDQGIISDEEYRVKVRKIVE
ncbi:MAG: SHOCT domain-containing protein [Deltaproteobacteria bacterium]|nr:SHOCT domain-containing protein [Deltaproteobacteria bacterium]